MTYGVDTDALSFGIISDASNIRQGSNVAYTADDFLSVYPQFESNTLLSVAINQGGQGYSVDDVLIIAGGSGGTAQVLSVATGGTVQNPIVGIVSSIAMRNAGTNYHTYNNVATTVDPAGGTGCTVNITASAEMVPTDLLGLFVEMANASIQQVRWRSSWKHAIGLYIAHFCVLYLQGKSPAGASQAQVVASAQMQFPKSSKSIGDVSVSYDTSSISGDLPGWAAWKTTSYGIQLATMARIVGAGGMMVW